MFCLIYLIVPHSARMVSHIVDAQKNCSVDDNRNLTSKYNPFFDVRSLGFLLRKVEFLLVSPVNIFLPYILVQFLKC